MRRRGDLPVKGPPPRQGLLQALPRRAGERLAAAPRTGQQCCCRAGCDGRRCAQHRGDGNREGRQQNTNASMTKHQMTSCSQAPDALVTGSVTCSQPNVTMDQESVFGSHDCGRVIDYLL